MSNVTQVVKTLSLDLSDIPREDVVKAKNEVGDYLVNSILREVGNGKSPVENEKFLKLKKKYAEKEHGGRRLPILELDGDMLAALAYKPLEGDKIEVGIRGSEAPKADGHNQLSEEAKSWASDTGRTKYKRRFIPDEEQKFNAKIRNGIDEILDGYRERQPQEIDEDEEQDEESAFFSIDTVERTGLRSTPARVRVTSSDFFSDDIIEEMLLEELKKKGRLVK
jgi:hypothetical protein